MAVTKKYHKFDDLYSYDTGIHLIDNKSGAEGSFSASFTYVVQESQEYGYLTMMRWSKDLMWTYNSDAVILAGDMRLRKDMTLSREGGHQGNGMFLELVQIGMNQLESQAFVEAGTSLEGRVGALEFSFGEGFVNDIKKAFMHDFDIDESL